MNDVPKPETCHPELRAIGLLEDALTTASQALLPEGTIPALDQDWIPLWRLPATGPGWIRDWLLAAAAGLQEARQAYRHALALDDQRQLRLLPRIDPDCPF